MIASAERRQRHVFLRDMLLLASIGVYPHEHTMRQRVRINVDLGVDEADLSGPERLDRVVDYERIATTVRGIVAAGHVMLAETLAERIAAACFFDARVRTARVRVEKLDVFDDIASAGVEIERTRPASAA